MWVTVSDDFNVMRILNELVQSLTKTNPQLSDLEAISGKIQQELNGDNFLLVLDDVWNQDSEKWDFMRDSLLYGSQEMSCLP